MTDAQAIKDGAYGQAGLSQERAGDDLRQIYAMGEGNLGPGRVGNPELLP